MYNGDLKMIKLMDTEKLNLKANEKIMLHAILGHLYYYLDNGYTETQIINVLKKLLDEIQK